jgi:hypothetical protein
MDGRESPPGPPADRNPVFFAPRGTKHVKHISIFPGKLRENLEIEI